MGSRHFPQFRLKDLEDNSPSRRDGVRLEQELSMKRAAIDLIIGAGMTLKMDHVAISTAVVCLHRFYAVRSLKHSSHFIVAMACLYLAGKVEDSPKSAVHILKTGLHIRMGSERDAVMYLREHQEAARKRLFIAERSLLYALGFDVSIAHPSALIISWFTKQPFADLKTHLGKEDFKTLVSTSFQLANESLKTTLCLQLPAETIAVGCIWLAGKLLQPFLKESLVHSLGNWWHHRGVTSEELQIIQTQICLLFGGTITADQQGFIGSPVVDCITSL